MKILPLKITAKSEFILSSSLTIRSLSECLLKRQLDQKRREIYVKNKP